MTRKFFKAAVAVAGLGLLAAQLIRPDTTNPPVDKAKSLLHNKSVDPRVGDILRRACADCHSHETAWPWYAKISPFSWWLDRHVKDGRAKLNLSDLANASQDEMEEIFDSVSKGKMPTPSYLIMHPQARLTAADQEVLQNWVDGKLTQTASR